MQPLQERLHFCAGNLRQDQVEGALKEDGHLVAGDRRGGAVIPTTATAGDAFGSQLLHPGRRPEVGGDIAKDGARGSRRCIG